MDPDSKQCEVFLIIHHPLKPEVLLRKDSSRGQLPCLVTQRRPTRSLYFESTREFLPEVRQHFGFTFQITLLRCMWYKRYNKSYNEDDLFRTIVVLESHGETVEPPDGTEWLESSCILFPESAVDDAKSAIEQFTQECRTGLQPAFRPLFARRGWYQGAVEWMKCQLSSKGFHPIDEVTQLKCSYRGAVLKAKLSNGAAVYLKCSHFTNEASVCNLLADLIPNVVAAPIATDIERRLLLMRDHGDITSPLLFDRLETTQFVNVLAQIHQSTIAKEQVLLDVGLRLLTFDMMEMGLDNALSFAEQAQLLSTDVIKQFETFSEEIKRDCRDVQELGIPSTFVHGDLYFSNVYRCHGTEASHGIMDFGEATISHPFVDILACRNRPAYSENWIDFLGKSFPQIAHGITKEKLLKCQVICIRLSSLWEAVKLCQEMDAVESPMPPQILHALRGELECLLKTYEHKHKPVKKSQNTST